MITGTRICTSFFASRQPETYHQGYLMVRVFGKWFTYDYASWENYLSHLICLQLGYSQAAQTKVKRLTEETLLRATDGKGKAEGEGHVEKVMEVVWIQCIV